MYLSAPWGQLYTGMEAGKGHTIYIIYVAIPGIHALMGYCRYCGSLVLQPQCVACSVAGVIS